MTIILGFLTPSHKKAVLCSASKSIDNSTKSTTDLLISTFFPAKKSVLMISRLLNMKWNKAASNLASKRDPNSWKIWKSMLNFKIVVMASPLKFLDGVETLSCQPQCLAKIYPCFMCFSRVKTSFIFKKLEHFYKNCQISTSNLDWI